MTALVEDLLLLARLDAGRPLEREPVDLTRLVVDAVSDAHAAGPDHRWQLDLPDEPVVVTGDAARLHQVLANLLANARTHTPPGTTVTVGAAPPADGGGADGRRRRPGHPGRAACRTSSSGSPAATARGPAQPAAPGWGWRSWTRSSPRTAAGSPCRAGRGDTQFTVAAADRRARSDRVHRRTHSVPAGR